MAKTRVRLPRTLWARCPATQVVPNKKALLAKRACRANKGRRPKGVEEDDERLR